MSKTFILLHKQNKIEAHEGETLDLVKPLSRNSYSCSFTSFNSIRVILYGDSNISLVPSSRSITNSIFLLGNNLNRFSRKNI